MIRRLRHSNRGFAALIEIAMVLPMMFFVLFLVIAIHDYFGQLRKARAAAETVMSQAFWCQKLSTTKGHTDGSLDHDFTVMQACLDNALKTNADFVKNNSISNLVSAGKVICTLGETRYTPTRNYWTMVRSYGSGSYTSKVDTTSRGGRSYDRLFSVEVFFPYTPMVPRLDQMIASAGVPTDIYGLAISAVPQITLGGMHTTQNDYY